MVKTGLYHVVINDDSHIERYAKEAEEMSKGVKETPEHLLKHEAEVKKAQAIYGTSEDVLKQITMLEDAGIQYLIVNLEASRELDALDIFANTIIKN